MKLSKARKFGKACGLTTDEEHVENVWNHCMNLFVYEEIDKEMSELLNEYVNSKKIKIGG